ncbi:uncharacterized protein LOC130892773 [Diorhabda carinulata]|uniref:uncharacterized protein LOC130892773 n=1 Tax=Diorhabda carinulata TaxID=1163345 RepID=UPI0025A290F5|nr:uncharacterized protein LOC130892773 [Diorhabda carinulata]
MQSIIQCDQKEICNLRSTEIYKSILKEAENLVEEETEDVLSRKRQVKVAHLENFKLSGPSSLRQNTETGHATEPFRPEFFKTIDLITAELKRRFSKNDELLASIAGLDELDVEKMRHLQDLGIKIPCKEETTAVKQYLKDFEDTNQNLLEILNKQRL